MSFDHSELLEKSPLAIVISDKNERIVWCNPRFLSEMHLSKELVIGKLYPSLPLEAIDKDAQIVQLFAENVAESSKFQYWQQPLDAPQGGKIHYFTCERQSNNKSTLAANKIGVNKLPKRASWVEFLDYEVSRSRRYDNPLSIMKLHLLVLHKPESVNQETLNQTIKDTLMDELRWADMIGHTDHGTFLTVLPETPADALKVLQQKITASIQRQIEFINSQINYQVVFGTASWRKHDDSQELLKRARSALVTNLEALLEPET